MGRFGFARSASRPGLTRNHQRGRNDLPQLTPTTAATEPKEETSTTEGEDMKKHKGDHLVIDSRTNPPSLKCNHCGRSWPLSLPIKVSALVKLERAFRDEHGDCIKDVRK